MLASNKIINEILKLKNKESKSNKPITFTKISDLVFFISTIDVEKEYCTFFDNHTNTYYNLYYNESTKEFQLYKRKQFVQNVSEKSFEALYFRPYFIKDKCMTVKHFQNFCKRNKITSNKINLHNSYLYK